MKSRFQESWIHRNEEYIVQEQGRKAEDMSEHRTPERAEEARGQTLWKGHQGDELEN